MKQNISLQDISDGRLYTLQLWCERMLDTGAIDPVQYHAYKEADKKS